MFNHPYLSEQFQSLELQSQTSADVRQLGLFVGSVSLEVLLEASEEAPITWSDETIVWLHFLLLDECEKLGDPETPLEEKLDLLRWIYTEPEKDDLPFSFANCLRVVGRATNPEKGTLDPDEIREGFRADLSHWLEESFSRYPAWVRDAFFSNPDHFAELLRRNPQRINEEVRRQAIQADLFFPIPSQSNKEIKHG